MWPIVGIARSAGVATRPLNGTGVVTATAGGSESLHRPTPGIVGNGAGSESEEGTGGGGELLTAPAYVSP